MTCCFFGHRDSPSGLAGCLESLLTELITEGVDSFLVGNQGGFDSLVLSTLRKIKAKYPHIAYHVVLAYMPGRKEERTPYDPMEMLLPEKMSRLTLNMSSLGATIG